jgi:hypothetical protein
MRQNPDHLIKHSTDNSQGMVIEYEVHGTILASGVAYDNRFCSTAGAGARKSAAC